MRTQLFINVSGLAVCLAVTIAAAEPLRLENDTLALRFDAASGTLTTVQNKLTGETYSVSGDEFAVEAVEFAIEFAKLKPAAVKQAGDIRRSRNVSALRGLTAGSATHPPCRASGQE